MAWRLYVMGVGLVFAAIAVGGAVVVQQREQDEWQRLEQETRLKALLARASLADSSLAPEDRQQTLARLRALTGCQITLFDAHQRILADSDFDLPTLHASPYAVQPEVQSVSPNGFSSDIRMATSDGPLMYYLALRVKPPARGVAWVRVAQPLTDLRRQLARWRWQVLGLAVLGSGAAALLLFWTRRRLLRPLRKLTLSAERIAAGAYGHKVYPEDYDDIGLLARTFNYMSERLAVQFAQLEEDRQQLRAVLSGMIEGVVALDAEQRILFVNERAAQLLEFDAVGSVGHKLWEVIRHPVLQEAAQQALEGELPRSRELTWNETPGKNLTLQAARLPGEPARGVVLVLHDTTELRRLERLRHEFVANVSHELKTPLSVITACVETLQDGAVEDVRHRDAFLEQIAEQSDRLLALIMDLISLARIESGDEVFEPRAVALEPLVGECLDRHRARAEAKQLRLEAIPPTLTAQNQDAPAKRAEVVAWADEEAVAQILDNLVDNAIKYTQAGGYVRVAWHSDGAYACLRVEDNGIGIPERDLPRIFERFYRVDKARSREMGGTGLGLSIVKHLAQAMQGTISAASQPGKGSTFTVRLPRPRNG
ncbi:MAG: ATP-binding protein [Gemmataceae bacterium]